MSEAPEGYLTMAGYDPAEDSIGPFYYRQLPDGSWRYAFFPEDKHCNASGIIHGGVLMTLADYALCMAATDHYAEENCVTVTFSSEFVAAAQRDAVVECEATVTRKTGSMAFVRGEIRAQDEEVVLTFSAVVKRLFPRK